MNQKHILTSILFTGLSLVQTQCHIILESNTEYNRHGRWETCVEFSENDKLVATSSDDGSVRILDGHTGEHIDKVSPLDPKASVTSLAFNPNGSELAIGDDNGSVYIYDCQSKVRWGLHRTSPVTSLAYKNTKKLFVAYEDGRLDGIDMDYRKPEDAPLIKYPSIQSMRLGNDSLLITKGNNRVDLISGNHYEYKGMGIDYSQLLGPITEHFRFDPADKIVWADCSKDGDKFVAISDSGEIKIVDRRSKEWFTLDEQAHSAQFSPISNAHLLTISAENNSAQLLELDFTGNEHTVIETFKGATAGSLISVRFNHSGTKCVGTYDTGTVIMWDIPQI